MNQKYDYKFIRIGKGNKSKGYQEVIMENAKEGWRLVQVFAPGAGGLWAKENYCEVIMEREISS